ncbi:hypothetical protein KCG51_07230 [Neisseria subflava]|uniref:hypothetical protein n=1 Tax=Neisseria subflava TaxID=28449 RepID=UPI0020B8A963|nr:hypothetical protein [Neisseria subflava]UTG76652.1 hypothetical protein KCG51_07230 [Neisseria subflava]
MAEKKSTQPTAQSSFGKKSTQPTAQSSFGKKSSQSSQPTVQKNKRPNLQYIFESYEPKTRMAFDSAEGETINNQNKK